MADLQYYETRPATQADLDRLIRHDVVLRAIGMKTYRMLLDPMAAEIHKLITDVQAIDNGTFTETRK
jgi:hypothetical protein